MNSNETPVRIVVSGVNTSPAKTRDPRLDFFRGLAMFFIYFAHCHGNLFYNWIPARFGPSDAADLFVFVSGMTVAIAFGGTFTRQGWLIGTARVAYRCLQLYATQIGMFCALAATVIVGTRVSGDVDYVCVECSACQLAGGTSWPMFWNDSTSRRCQSSPRCAG
jgi:hypothetical protein